MADELNILNEIVAPDLTSTEYAQNLQQVFQNINDNFKKLVATPIMRGQQGKNVKILSQKIIDGEDDTFTTIGKQLVTAIYGTADGINNLANLRKYENDTKGLNGFGGVYASDCFKTNSEILFFCYDNVDNTPLCPAQTYYFLDKRVGLISGQPGAGEATITDVTCYVTFEWDEEESTYTLVKDNSIPSIQWNAGLGEYTWTLGGQQTNVTVRGIKGADATYVTPILKTEVSSTDATVRTCDNILVDNAWAKPNKSNTVGINPGMFCVVYTYTDKDTEKIDGVAFEKVISVDVENDNGTITTTKTGFNIGVATLWNLLTNIRPSVDGITYRDTETPGLFIPTTPSSGNNYMVHALWRGKNGKNDDNAQIAHFGYAKLEEINGIKSLTFETKNASKTDLQIGGYNNIKMIDNDVNIHMCGLQVNSNKISCGGNNYVQLTSGESGGIIMMGDKINITSKHTGIKGSINLTSDGINLKSNNIKLLQPISGLYISAINNADYQTCVIKIGSAGNKGRYITFGSNELATTEIKDDKVKIIGNTIIGAVNKTVAIEGITSITGNTTILGGEISIGDTGNNTTIKGKTITIRDDEYKPYNCVLDFSYTLGGKDKLYIKFYEFGHLMQCDIKLHLTSKVDAGSGAKDYWAFYNLDTDREKSDLLPVLDKYLPHNSGLTAKLTDPTGSFKDAEKRENTADFYLDKNGRITIWYHKSGSASYQRDYYGTTLFIPKEIDTCTWPLVIG